MLGDDEGRFVEEVEIEGWDSCAREYMDMREIRKSIQVFYGFNTNIICFKEVNDFFNTRDEGGGSRIGE